MFFESEVLNHITVAVIIFLLSAILSSILKLFLNKFITRKSVELNTDATGYKFLKNSINFVVLFTATVIIFYTIPSLKQVGITLLASAGIFAAIVGFASQAAFSNIFSGIFIVLFKPFRVGDIVSIQTNTGIVDDITLRHTVIKNFENKRIIIPNSVISNETIVNSHIGDPRICNFFEVGISYDSDMDLAIKIITEEVIKHPLYLDTRSEKEEAENKPSLRIKVLGWGESSINIRAYAWTKDHADGFNLKCDLYKSVKERFNREGVEIPYPHRTIVTKSVKQ
jgi:small-conductance mechanosensitive channel